MRWSHIELKHLREGGNMKGRDHLLLTSTEVLHSGVWICGSEFMLKRWVTDLNEAFVQLVEASDEAILFQVELDSEKLFTVIADLDKDLGQLTMDIRRPFCVIPLSQIDGDESKMSSAKTLPLPPEMETFLESSMRRYKTTFIQRRDGSFELRKGS